MPLAVAVVDAGPLVAAADSAAADHRHCVEALERSDLQLVFPALVVQEASYLIAGRLGPAAEATFFAALAGRDIESPGLDCHRISELIREYADFRLGGADASVVALAERLSTPIVITLDRRHFSAVRPKHCDVLQLLPAPLG